MTIWALLLVLTAAVLHATWNYWAKRAGGGLPFVYLVCLLICTGYLPVLAVYSRFHYIGLSVPVLAAIFVSGALKTAYSLLLQRGYRLGDFSLIYPLARGTGPLLSAVGAMLLFHERPSTVSLVGAIAIVASIFWIAGGHRWFQPRETTADHVATRRASFYGVTAGIAIATYTLWDKRGVAHLMIAPVVYDFGTSLVQIGLLAPLAWRRRAEIAREWREHRRNALIMATASPLGYVLILTAMKTTPVSYVAPAREVSILIGLFFGARWLNEKEAHRRIWAAATMVAGLAALALG